MKFSIKVPATSANLGPGFDALGLALDLWNETTLSTDVGTDKRIQSTDSIPDSRRETDVRNGSRTDAINGSKTDERMGAKDKRISVSVEGEGAGWLAPNEKNLIVRAAQSLAERAGKPLPLFHAECVNQIPLSSGMGSSSAAILTGLLGGNALLENPFSREEILNLASEIEGHPDNVAPALMGGLVVSTMHAGKVIAQHIPMSLDMHITIVLPDFHLPTKQARAALPRKISMKNAVHNISRAVLVTEAFRNGDLNLLGKVMTDTLHQPYRLPLIPGAHAAMEAAKEAGANAVALSGAGPSLIAFSSKAEAGIGASMKRAFEAVGLKARIFNLRVSDQGAEIQNS